MTTPKKEERPNPVPATERHEDVPFHKRDNWERRSPDANEEQGIPDPTPIERDKSRPLDGSDD